MIGKLTILLTLLLALVTAAIAQPDIRGDIVGYWSFNENGGYKAYDRSANGNDGTLVNAGWTRGISGSALELNGTSSFVNIPDSDALDITGDYTIVTWVNLSSMPFVAPIVTKGSTKHNFAYYLAVGTLYDHKINVQHHPAHNGNFRTYSNWPLKIGVWYQVAAVREDDKLSIYLDGALNSVRYGTEEPLRVNDLSLYVGSHYEHEYLFHGAIDELCILDRALTAAEVAYLYQHPDGCNCRDGREVYAGLASTLKSSIVIGISPPQLGSPLTKLSGGNQQ